MSWTLGLLALTWFGMYGTAHEIGRRREEPWNWQIAWVFATIAWGITLVAITELLSLLVMLRRDALLVAWSIALLAAGGLYLRLRTRRLGWASPQLPRDVTGADPAILTLLTLLIMIMLTLALIALAYAPNNWDSMTYHLSRVMHWQQNASVAHYATSIGRQIQMPPFAEFVILHLDTLSGNDRWANMVQWFAMVGCAVGVTQIARRLGASAREQVAAALLTSAIPVGVTQATSTQNDYVVALWMVCAVAMAIELLRSGGAWLYGGGLGLALGLAILTKGTAMVLAVPLALIVAGALVWHLRAAALARGALIAVLALAVPAGHFARNQSLYGSPIGPTEGIRNPELSLAVMTSTALRNVAINLPHHAGLPLLQTIGERGRDLVGLVHSFTGIDPQDARFSWTSDNPFATSHSFDEDYTGNLVHTLLVVAALTYGAIRAARRHQYPLLAAMGGCVAAFLLFSLLLRWQIWGNRLMLPLFVLWCPLVVIALGGDAQGRRMMLLACAVALLSLPWVFNIATRPIDSRALYMPREQQYFTKRPELFQQYRDVAELILASGCRRVGLVIGGDSWEYPLWVLLRRRGFEGTITHEEVDNSSATLAVRAEPPCALISDYRRYARSGYFDLQFPSVTLFLQRDLPALPLPPKPGIVSDEGLSIYLGKGWYEYEPKFAVRWMQRSGEIWVHAERAGPVRLELIPHVMNVNGTFGSAGSLRIYVEGKLVTTLEVALWQPVAVDLVLVQGYNRIQFAYLGGDFSPEGDGRRLGITFKRIGFKVLP